MVKETLPDTAQQSPLQVNEPDLGVNQGLKKYKGMVVSCF
jgi:hypothetical protein